MCLSCGMLSYNMLVQMKSGKRSENEKINNFNNILWIILNGGFHSWHAIFKGLFYLFKRYSEKKREEQLGGKIFSLLIHSKNWFNFQSCASSIQDDGAACSLTGALTQSQLLLLSQVHEKRVG